MLSIPCQSCSFFKNTEYKCVAFTLKSKSNKINQQNQSELNKNLPIWTKKNWGQYYSRDQIWGQAKFLKPGQNVFGANFEARPGHWGQARPGFIECLLDWHRGREAILQKCHRKFIFQSSLSLSCDLSPSIGICWI